MGYAIGSTIIPFYIVIVIPFTIHKFVHKEGTKVM
jgi:hypothetical protein